MVRSGGFRARYSLIKDLRITRVLSLLSRFEQAAEHGFLVGTKNVRTTPQDPSNTVLLGEKGRFFLTNARFLYVNQGAAGRTLPTPGFAV